MLTSSAKSKGRSLQKLVCGLLLSKAYNLEPDDILSRGMGQNGEDVMLSPAARRQFPFWIECKKVEKLNVVNVFNEHYQKYKDKIGFSLLVHSKNRQEPLITMKLTDFINIYADYNNHIKVVSDLTKEINTLRG